MSHLKTFYSERLWPSDGVFRCVTRQASLCMSWSIEKLQRLLAWTRGFVTEKPACPLRDTYTQPGEQRLSGRADTAAQSDSQRLYTQSNAPPLPFTAHQHQNSSQRHGRVCVFVCVWVCVPVILRFSAPSNLFFLNFSVLSSQSDRRHTEGALNLYTRHFRLHFQIAIRLASGGCVLNLKERGRTGLCVLGCFFDSSPPEQVKGGASEWRSNCNSIIFLTINQSMCLPEVSPWCLFWRMCVWSQL